jgi:L-threonylcarbamoyladenylate synthase
MQIINQKNPQAINLAINYLNSGKIIAFPTDTVYGVAIDATNQEAVKKLYELKQRDFSKPISIFVKDLETAKKLFIFDDLSLKIASKYTPGALTMILKTTNYAKKILAKNLNINDIENDFVGFRIIDSFFIRNFFKKFNGILAVTSANKSGQNSCSSASCVMQELPKIDLLISGNITGKIASTVIKIHDNNLKIIRQGKLIINLYESS